MQFLVAVSAFFRYRVDVSGQYAKAGILMLPVVEPAGTITARQIVLFSIMLVPVSLAPFFFGSIGIIFLVGAIVLGSGFYGQAFRRHAQNKRESQKASAGFRDLFATLFILMVADKR